jgi:hypothetical protein
VSKKKIPTQKNWRPTPEDFKLLCDLKAKMGVLNETDIIRQALRALAAKEGLAA